MSPESYPPEPQSAPPSPKKPLAWWRAVAVALLLIVAPSVVAGPMFVPFVILWLLFAFPLTFRRKWAPVRKERLRNLGIYLAAAATAIALYSLSLDRAQARGQVLVAAIKAYRADQRTYPPNLDALVPKYTERIPAAAYGRYFYHFDPARGEPLFFFVTMPPFGRRGYCFEDPGKCMGMMPPDKDGWYDFD